jgi:hypothetical protein
LKVDLGGDLAGILAIAVSGKKPAPGGSGFSDKRDRKTQFELVAGERNQLKLRCPKGLASQVQLVAENQLNLLICAVA